MLSFDEILKANNSIRHYIYDTPLEKSCFFSEMAGGEVFLKLECQQVMKSFKVRGVFNKLIKLSDEERKKQIAAASSGNHGAALSYASSLLNINSVKIYVPEITPKAKIEKIQRYGASLVIMGKDYDDTYELAQNEIKGQDVIWVDSSSDDDIIAGQGTIALEILKKNPDIDCIVVPIGGGGIITGISIAAKKLKPGIKIIGVQPALCPSMLASIRDNVFYKKYPSEDSVCEALVGGIGEIPFKYARQCIDEVLLVSENAIKKAVFYLLEEDKVLSEPSAAVGAACIMEAKDKFKGLKTAVVISGGNVDMEFLLHKGG